MSILSKTNVLLAMSAIAFTVSRVNPWFATGLFFSHAVLSQIKKTGRSVDVGDPEATVQSYPERDFYFSKAYTVSAAVNVLATVAMVTGSPALIAPAAAYLIVSTFVATLAKLLYDERSEVSNFLYDAKMVLLLS